MLSTWSRLMASRSGRNFCSTLRVRLDFAVELVEFLARVVQNLVQIRDLLSSSLTALAKSATYFLRHSSGLSFLRRGIDALCQLRALGSE